MLGCIAVLLAVGVLLYKLYRHMIYTSEREHGNPVPEPTQRPKFD